MRQVHREFSLDLCFRPRTKRFSSRDSLSGGVKVGSMREREEEWSSESIRRRKPDRTQWMRMEQLIGSESIPERRRAQSHTIFSLFDWFSRESSFPCVLIVPVSVHLSSPISKEVFLQLQSISPHSCHSFSSRYFVSRPILVLTSLFSLQCELFLSRNSSITINLLYSSHGYTSLYLLFPSLLSIPTFSSFFAHSSIQ